MGNFTRDQVEYGQALSVKKPPKNDPGSATVKELLNPALDLSRAQEEELQARIDSLYQTLRGEREWFT
jgi:hypothetical protein